MSLYSPLHNSCVFFMWLHQWHMLNVCECFPLSGQWPWQPAAMPHYKKCKLSHEQVKLEVCRAFKPSSINSFLPVCSWWCPLSLEHNLIRHHFLTLGRVRSMPTYSAEMIGTEPGWRRGGGDCKMMWSLPSSLQLIYQPPVLWRYHIPTLHQKPMLSLWRKGGCWIKRG